MENSLPLYTAAQVRAQDAWAIAQAGIPGYVLMQRAAAAAYAELQRAWPQARALLVLAGPGNNGGDALELARLARQDGKQVDCVLVADPARLRGEARQAYLACTAGGQVLLTPEQLDSGRLGQADVIVDGLLGTGLTRPVAAEFARLIDAVRHSARPVLALDLPSGIHADTGAVMGAAIQADLSVSFIGRKQGLYTGAALDHIGRRVFADLQVPAQVYAQTPARVQQLPLAVPARALPRRSADSHKGRFGHVLAIGGAPGFSGAIALCGQAALRAGAGLVSVLTHPDSRIEVSLATPELMVRGLDTATDPQWQALFGRASVLALGPGLGQGAWAEALLASCLDSTLPLVLDADGLNALGAIRELPPGAIMTPHPGEAARLLGCDTGQIQADRYAAARELAARSGAVTVLKGAGSIVAQPDGSCWVCAAGNPGMAVGGMGDVLTGLIAGLRAQGCAARDAACLGVLVHALAGDRAAQQGQRGLLPSDLLPLIRPLVNP